MSRLVYKPKLNGDRPFKTTLDFSKIQAKSIHSQVANRTSAQQWNHSDHVEPVIRSAKLRQSPGRSMGKHNSGGNNAQSLYQSR